MYLVLEVVPSVADVCACEVFASYIRSINLELVEVCTAFFDESLGYSSKVSSQ